LKSYRIFQADIQSGSVAFGERVRKHPLMFIWFFLLFVTAMWLIAVVVHATILIPSALVVEFDPTWAYYGIFFLFVVLAGIGSHFRMMRNTDLVHVLAQPVPFRSVLFGKFMTVFWLNMLIYTFGMGTELVIIQAFGLYPFITLQVFIQATLLVVAGTFVGFFISICGSLQPMPRKIFYLWLGSMFLTAVWFGLDMEFLPLSILLVVVIILAGADIFLGSAFFLEGWNAQTTVRPTFGKGEAHLFVKAAKRLPASRTAKAVARKEFLFNARTRENLGSALTLVGIFVAELAAIQTLGPRDEIEIEFAFLVYPIVNAMAIYVGAVLFCTVEGLTLLGKESRGFWVVKHLPTKGRDIMEGKALAALLAALFVLVIAVPIPILVYWDPSVVAFSIIGTLALVFSFLGIGLWVGAVAPNFTSSFRGTPDVITLYSTMMICLVLGTILLFPPLIMFMQDTLLGLLAVVISAEIGATLLLLGMELSGRAYDRLEVNL
jgi:hypothetical protein